jgi:hypothetical protein
MIDQIRHLQSKVPFETFALELSNGRVIQIEDPHQVATASGRHVTDKGVIGVLYDTGRFEVISTNQLASISVGLHPKVAQELSEKMAEVKKRFGAENSR